MVGGRLVVPQWEEEITTNKWGYKGKSGFGLLLK
jgi:hypothetical protein